MNNICSFEVMKNNGYINYTKKIKEINLYKETDDGVIYVKTIEVDYIEFQISNEIYSKIERKFRRLLKDNGFIVKCSYGATGYPVRCYYKEDITNAIEEDIPRNIETLLVNRFHDLNDKFKETIPSDFEFDDTNYVKINGYLFDKIINKNIKNKRKMSEKKEIDNGLDLLDKLF